MGLGRVSGPVRGLRGIAGFFDPLSQENLSSIRSSDRGTPAAASAEETRYTPQTPQPPTTDGEQAGLAFTWLHGLLDALGSGRQYEGSTIRQCPAHEDAHPSLNVSPGRDGKVVIYCHAGCDWRAIVAALGIPARYLFEPPPVAPSAYVEAFLVDRVGKYPPLSRRTGKSPQARGFRLVAIHDYGSNHRVLRYRKGAQKDMYWETRRGELWEPGLFDVPTAALPAYLAQDVLAAVHLGDPVVLCESESSVDEIVRTAGLVATTWAGGASTVQLGALRKVLILNDIVHPGLVVVPDNDEPGLAALATLTDAGLVPHLLMPEPGEDARDLLDRVGPEQFRVLVNGAIGCP